MNWWRREFKKKQDNVSPVKKKIHKCYDVLTIVCVLIIETESSGFVFFLTA